MLGDAGPEEGALSSFREAHVRELFVTLGKALRAFQLYHENNPVYQRFVTALRDAFTQVWRTEEQLTVAVEESRLLLDEAVVYSSDNRADSLAFLLYKDGVREVTFLPGIEGEELERLLSVLHRVRYVGTETDDVLTMLWEEGLQHFRYEFTDYLSEGVVVPEPGGGADADQLRSAHDDAVAEAAAAENVEDQRGEGEGAPHQVVSRESFNPTLYVLDPKELDELRRELDRELARDLRANVLNALFDRLEEPHDVERQSEILAVLRTLLPNLLGRGAIDAAASVLHELREIEGRPGVLDEQRRREVAKLLDEVSSPQVMGELVHALEEGSVAPSPRQLGEFLEHLRPQALASLLRASETVTVKALQPVLRDAVGGIARRNQALLVELIASGDALVAAGAARLAGALQVAEAAPAIQKLLGHPDPEARLAAVEAAAEVRASTLAGALQDALVDPDRTVRIAAARALGKLRYRPAAQRFRALLTGKEMRSADITEKIAFFEGYAELGDREAVPILDRLLNGKGLLGRREPGEVRAAAALALGKIGTPDALRALEGARGDDDAIVRSAVNRAVRDGREASR
jgi:hypothetical protein